MHCYIIIYPYISQYIVSTLYISKFQKVTESCEFTFSKYQHFSRIGSSFRAGTLSYISLYFAQCLVHWRCTTLIELIHTQNWILMYTLTLLKTKKDNIKIITERGTHRTINYQPGFSQSGEISVWFTKKLH